MSKSDTAVTVWGHADLREDATGQLSVQALLAPNSPVAFSNTAGRSTQLGFSQSDFWLRFRVHTDSSARRQTWLVHNKHLFTDRLTFFLVDEQSKIIEQQQWGQGLPASVWDVLFYEGVFRLNLEPNRTYTVLLRMSGNDSKVFNPTIWETHSFYQFTQGSTWIHALYIGTLLFTILFQLIFFLFTRERNFLLYLLYLISFLFVQILIGNGLPGEVYLWPQSVWMNQNAILLAAPLCVACGMFFFANGLKLWDHSRWLFRLLQLDGLVALLLTTRALLDPTGATNSTEHILMIALISNTLVLIACVISLLKGFKPALYYLLATLSFLLGILVIFLWHQGLVPVNIFTNYSVDIGSLFEVVFFTLGLADDYRRTQRQEQNTQRQLIQTLQDQNTHITQALLQGQTLERHRVAADLHDNLGTTLTSLQWTLSALDKRNLAPAERDLYLTLTQRLDQAYNDVRLLAHNLMPIQLAKTGLGGALQTFVDQLNHNNGVQFVLTLPPDLPRFDARIEFEVYSICLELCTNILKHARATEAQVTLLINQNQLSLTVSDNGVGLTNETGEGRGLQNIRARAHGLGGMWQITSEPGQGVTHQITVPVRTLARAETQI